MSLSSNAEMMQQLDEIRQEVKITKFENFSKTVPELRMHVLKYANKKTLRAYSQCSKQCNEEVQKFNTIAPYRISLNDNGHGIDVELTYWIIREDGQLSRTPVVHKEFRCAEGSNTVYDIERHLLKYYKHVKTGTTHHIYIEMNDWPTRVTDLLMMSNISEWDLTLNHTMFDGFMEYFKTREDNIEDITIDDLYGEITIPSEFFKYPFLKKVQVAHINVTCSIEDNDFVNLHIPTLKIYSVVSNEAIQEKVALINADRTIEMRQIEITVPGNNYEPDYFLEDDDFAERIFHRYNISEIFPEADVLVSESGIHYCIIGRVLICDKKDRRVLMLTDEIDLFDD